MKQIQNYKIQSIIPVHNETRNKESARTNTSNTQQFSKIQNKLPNK